MALSLAPKFQKRCAKFLALPLFCLLLLGCGAEEALISDHINDAESLVMTPDGRLFVAGSTNVYEVIKRQDGRYLKLKLFAEDQACGAGGIGLINSGDYLYAHCTAPGTAAHSTSESMLLVSTIIAPRPTEYDVEADKLHPAMSFTEVSPLPGLLLPAGMAMDGSGNLYIADTGKDAIFRITFSTPELISSITEWNQAPIHSISGLEWVGDNLYFTAMKEGTLTATLGYVKGNPDGTAGLHSIVFEKPYTVFDDIAVYDQGLIITDYLKGALIYWKDGAVQGQTAADSFHSPTSVAVGRPPLFSVDTLLITEQGVSLDSNPLVGNRLVSIEAPF